MSKNMFKNYMDINAWCKKASYETNYLSIGKQKQKVTLICLKLTVFYTYMQDVWELRLCLNLMSQQNRKKKYVKSSRSGRLLTIKTRTPTYKLAPYSVRPYQRHSGNMKSIKMSVCSRSVNSLLLCLFRLCECLCCLFLFKKEYL